MIATAPEGLNGSAVADVQVVELVVVEGGAVLVVDVVELVVVDVEGVCTGSASRGCRPCCRRS